MNMTSYKAKTITIREWQDLMQTPLVWNTFMDHPERLSAQDFMDFVYGAKFFPFGEEEGVIYYTLVAMFNKSQALIVVERDRNGDLEVKSVAT